MSPSCLGRKNNPLSILCELTQKNRYKTTSLATELLGTNKTVEDLTLEEVRDYYDIILVPTQMLLSIVGNISDEEVSNEPEVEVTEQEFSIPKEIKSEAQGIQSWSALTGKITTKGLKEKKYIQDTLGYIKDLVVKEFYSKTINLKADARRRSTAYFPLKKPIIIQKNKNLNQSRFQISIPSAPYSSAGYKYSKLFEIYLRSFLSSKLKGEGGVYGLDVEIKQFKNNAHLNITFAVDYEDAVVVYKKVQDLLTQLKSQSITKREFDSLKTAYQTIISLGHERMSDLAKRYNKWLFLNGELFSLTKEIKQVSSLSYEDFIYITGKMLDKGGRQTVYLGKKLNEDDLK